VDGKGAMEYFKAHPELKMSQWDMRQVIKGWGQSAPQEALSWFSENAEFAQKFQPANAVLQGWSREDPDAATAWLLANSSSPAMTAASLSEIMLEQLYGKGLLHAGEWLAALPDTEAVSPAKHMAWMSIQGRFRELGSEDAAAVWRTMGSQSWMGWQDFEGFTGNVAAANGGDTAFLNAAASGDSAGQISSQFERWAATEPERSSAWLTRHPDDSPFRTAAIRGMLRHLDKTDPEAAAAWRQQLPP
jgi:hypothetical protein